MTLLQQIRLIEELAANAWLAEVAPVVSGWPNDDTGLAPLQDKLAEAERFYAARGEPARFQICPACQPADLDEILARRGYQTHSLTSVQTAPLGTALSRRIASALASDPALPVETRGALSDDWFEVYARVGNMNGREHRLPHTGRLDLGALLRDLAGDGFAGTISVELRPDSLEYTDPAALRRNLRDSLAFCRQHL